MARMSGPIDRRQRRITPGRSRSQRRGKHVRFRPPRVPGCIVSAALIIGGLADRGRRRPRYSTATWPFKPRTSTARLLWRGSDVESSRRQAGFTLIEMVVGLAILALSLAVIFNIMSNSIREAGRGERVSKAGLLAQSLLAQVGAELPIQEGETTGRTGNFRWGLRIRSFLTTNDRPQRPVGAYTISAEVHWDEDAQDRSVVLTTMRLGPKRPSP